MNHRVGLWAYRRNGAVLEDRNRVRRLAQGVAATGLCDIVRFCQVVGRVAGTTSDPFRPPRVPD